MASAVSGVVMIAMILGFVAGWIAGWAARGEGNRAWRASCDRKLWAAQARAREAEVQAAEAAEAAEAADRAYAVMQRVPAVVHVHVDQPLPSGAGGVIADVTRAALVEGPGRES